MTLAAVENRLIEKTHIEPACRFAIDQLAAEESGFCLEAETKGWGPRLASIAAASHGSQTLQREQEELFGEIIAFGDQVAGVFLDQHPELLEPIRLIVEAAEGE